MEFNDGLIERLLHQSLCYAKLCRTRYWDYLDPVQFGRYQYEIDQLAKISLEAEENDPNATLKPREYTFGKRNDYAGNRTQGDNFAQWLKMEGGEIAEHGIRSFVKSVDKLTNIVGGWLRQLKIKWKLRNIKPDYVMEKFMLIPESIKVRVRHDHAQVEAPEMSMMLSRLEGYVNICDEIHNLADKYDQNAFDSDKTWNNFASLSNRALYARPPREGKFFRELQRTEPIVRKFDAGASDWADASAVRKLADQTCKTKKLVLDKIQEDLDIIKRTTDGLKSDVSHFRAVNVSDMAADQMRKTREDDEIDEMVVKYARGYVAAKFVMQLQDCFASECLYLVEDLPKLFSPSWNDNRKEKQAAKASAQKPPEAEKPAAANNTPKE